MNLFLTLVIAMQVSKKMPYDVDGTKMESVLIYDDTVHAKPGLVLVPNYFGITDANLKQAKEIAARGYTVLVADVYGVSVRPKTADDASKAASVLKEDRKLLRTRMLKALEVLRAQKGSFIDPRSTAAIGFCFGGTAALELARAGAELQAVATFHAGLSSTLPGAIRAKVLAMHGADDPFVPPTEVQSFQDEMRTAKVDWQLVSYGNAVHSFTDVDANNPGKAMYNAVVAKRAYDTMDRFFVEAFAVKH